MTSEGQLRGNSSFRGQGDTSWLSEMSFTISPNLSRHSRPVEMPTDEALVVDSDLSYRFAGHPAPKADRAASGDQLCRRNDHNRVFAAALCRIHCGHGSTVTAAAFVARLQLSEQRTCDPAASCATVCISFRISVQFA